MLQIRKDYLLDDYVIIATDRGKRPFDFKEENKSSNNGINCAFCSGNENMLPKIIKEQKKINGAWIVRVVENKYKAAAPVGDKRLFTDNMFYTWGNCVGDHEVIIETSNHDKELEDLGGSAISLVLRMIISRVKQHYHNGVEYVCVFKNRGREAGASFSHSHHQLISYNLLPTKIKEEILAVKEFKQENGVCPYCDIIKREKDSERRIAENHGCVSFTPYASSVPMHAWIMPKRCVHSITELNNSEIYSLALMIKKVLQSLNRLNYPAYNILYKMSNDNNQDYHFRIEIIPRLSKLAGFEFTTGTIINTISPEDAAKFYRKEV